MKRIVRNRQYGLSWKGDYGPRILAKLEKHRQRVGTWNVDWNGGNHYEVYYENADTQTREAFAVSLIYRTCSCRLWDVCGVPCHHALVAITFEGKDPLDFIDDYFKKSTYMKAYEALLHPVRGLSYWEQRDLEELHPPPLRQAKGKRKTERIREPLEGRKKTKMSRIGRKMKCGICKQTGHNSRRCPLNPKEDCHNVGSKKRKTNPSKVAKQKAGGSSNHMVYTVCNPGKDNQLIVGRPVGKPRKYFNPRKFKEASSSQPRTEGNAPSQNPDSAIPTQ
ncbi:Zinc finger, PMZ-type [Corchorus capsularis]|uniref:Zinc finger, PMZ-type n=1 Tax=Corchorus capsularis TaxID=210143 RepID=A0A1R3KFI6_COCAP|nr:Zinc finger, PMZ-type [Corchorus capsularis]